MGAWRLSPGSLSGLLVVFFFLIPGAYSLSPASPQHLSPTATGRGLWSSPSSFSGSSQDDVRARIEGMVYGAEGEALADATLVISGSGIWPARTLESDTRGYFVIDALPEGVYEIYAKKGPLVSAPYYGLELEAGDTIKLAFLLEEGKAYRGRIVDAENGAPISEASVSLRYHPLDLQTMELRPDAQGWFSFRAPTESELSLQVEAPGYVAFGPRPWPEDSPSMTIELRRGLSLKGRVFDERDRPLEGALVEVRAFKPGQSSPRPSAPSPFAALRVTQGKVPKISDAWNNFTPMLFRPTLSTTTPADGHFELQGVPKERFIVRISHHDYVPFEEIFSPTPTTKDLDELSISLEPAGKIIGKVVDANAITIQGARVELSRADEALTARASDAEGRFIFHQISGEVVLVAHVDAQASVRQSFFVEPGESLEVTLTLPEAKASLRGIVRDESDHPIENAQISLRSLSADHPILRKQTTSTQGEFLFRSLIEGRYQLTVEIPGYQSFTEAIDTADGDDIAIVMARSIAISGFVVDDASGLAIPNASVVVREHGKRSTTNEEGFFAIAGLQPGPQELSLSHPNYETLTLDIEALFDRFSPTRPTELDTIRLRAAGSIRGKVLDTQGNLIAGAEITWGDPPLWDKPTLSDSGGRFVLNGVAIGSISLWARYPGNAGSETSQTAYIRAGERNTEVELELPELEQEALEEEWRTGVPLQLIQEEEDIVVIRIIHPDAESYPLRIGDILLRIDNIAFENLEEAERLLEGPSANDAIIELEREGETLELFAPRIRYPLSPPD